MTLQEKTEQVIFAIRNHDLDKDNLELDTIKAFCDLAVHMDFNEGRTFEKQFDELLTDVLYMLYRLRR